MSSRVAATAAQLRSAEPATRIAGARALADLVRCYGLDALPALLASIDAAAIEFPGEGKFRPTEEPRPYAFYEPLHEGWRAAAEGDAEAAHEWYTALLDRIEAADPKTGARLLHVLTQDPWASPKGAGSPYGPLLAANATRVLGLLAGWTEAEQPAGRPGRLLLAIRQQATRQDPIMAELVQLGPVLLPADATGGAGDWIDLVLERHPDPLEGLAALLSAVPYAGPRRRDYAETLRGLLVTTDRVDLPDLAVRLRPYAERWTDDQLELVVREVLLGTGKARPSLPVVLRRAPDTRAVPEMLLDLGRSTPALAELSVVLADALAPRPAEPRAGTGVVFADENFKLVVINQLMYEQSVLTPKFDRDAFIDSFDDHEIEDTNGPTEEVLDYFRALPLTPEDLAQVVELDVDPCADIWSQIDEGWGGEEDYFAPTTYVDVAHLPNLRKIAIDMDAEEADLSALYARGIEVEVD
ncbi:hypothetical protein AB0M54_18925 [Actinoplanes sp. NPDC051470]|uniref:DUF6892 domain-containing protein n=1 Tax=Actinoplanes sp. NPDC051470 TaxID=3157224 RepID=UPI0034227885